MKNLIFAILTVILLSMTVCVSGSYAVNTETTKTTGQAVRWERVYSNGHWWMYGYDEAGDLVEIVLVDE